MTLNVWLLLFHGVWSKLPSVDDRTYIQWVCYLAFPANRHISFSNYPCYQRDMMMMMNTIS